jgi:hypothetical protein
LSLPDGGYREDVIRTKVFEDYIRSNVVSWFNWTQENQLVEHMEDLILVSGCTLVSSWAAAAFVGNTTEAEVSLERRTSNNGTKSFVWSNNQGHVVVHNNIDSVRSPGLVCSACTDIYILEAESTHNSGSMRLHQGIPSKTHFLPDQAHACCSRTPS